MLCGLWETSWRKFSVEDFTACLTASCACSILSSGYTRNALKTGYLFIEKVIRKESSLGSTSLVSTPGGEASLRLPQNSQNMFPSQLADILASREDLGHHHIPHFNWVIKCSLAHELLILVLVFLEHVLAVIPTQSVTDCYWRFHFLHADWLQISCLLWLYLLLFWISLSCLSYRAVFVLTRAGWVNGAVYWSISVFCSPLHLVCELNLISTWRGCSKDREETEAISAILCWFNTSTTVVHLVLV